MSESVRLKKSLLSKGTLKIKTSDLFITEFTYCPWLTNNFNFKRLCIDFFCDLKRLQIHVQLPSTFHLKTICKARNKFLRFM